MLGCFFFDYKLFTCNVGVSESLTDKEGNVKKLDQNQINNVMEYFDEIREPSLNRNVISIEKILSAFQTDKTLTAGARDIIEKHEKTMDSKGNVELVDHRVLEEALKAMQLDRWLKINNLR